MPAMTRIICRNCGHIFYVPDYSDEKRYICHVCTTPFEPPSERRPCCDD